MRSKAPDACSSAGNLETAADIVWWQRALHDRAKANRQVYSMIRDRTHGAAAAEPTKIATNQGSTRDERRERSQ
jgi:hypothetical protein